MSPEFAFCERVSATATSPWHIRRVGDEGLKLGGGAPDTTLCGAELRKGWDLTRTVDVATVRLLADAVCSSCSAVFAGGTE